MKPSLSRLKKMKKEDHLDKQSLGKYHNPLELTRLKQRILQKEKSNNKILMMNYKFILKN